MTALDDAIGPLALTMISQFGKSATIKRATAGQPDHATSRPAGSPTTAQAAVKVIVEEPKGSDYVTGLIEAGDRKFTVAAQGLPFDPAPGDLLSEDDNPLKPWTVKVARAVYSGERPALYELFARRS